MGIDFQQKLVEHLAQLKLQGIYRQRNVVQESDFTYFNKNDYLSLTNDVRIKQAYIKGFQLYPTSSSGSGVICGYHEIHQSFEAELASALNVDACLLFSSGYAANLSLMNFLAQFDAHLYIDKSIHASLYDGIKLSSIAYSRFLHQDLSDLEKKIKLNSGDNSLLETLCITSDPYRSREQVAGRRNTNFLIVESLYSMSGQVAPLNQMLELMKNHEGQVIVDEAHAFGVLGSEGLGSIVQQGLSQQDIPLRVIPLGKAFAASGAVIAGNGIWIEALLQSARSYIYSTAISPAFCYGLLETLPILRAADERRIKLFQLVNYFREAIQQSPLQWRDSFTPIQQLQLGCPHKSLQFAKQLSKKGIICSPIRQPTVNKSETGLRIVINYAHQPEQIDDLFEKLHLLNEEWR